MFYNFRQMEYFFTQKIWYINEEEMPYLKKKAFIALKKLVITVECFYNRNINSYASALTFSTVLAIVPILAIVFAIGRGFGYGTLIEAEVKKNLSVNQQFADLIFEFIGSYLDHTQSGIFIGFGLLLLLYTVIQLTSNIEIALNEIWQIRNQRSIYHQITDYLAVLFLLPILIIITSGFSIFLTTVSQYFPHLLSSTVQVIMIVSPYVVSSLLFIALFCYMPNTRVQVRSAIVPGILAGVAFQGLQYVYINSQIWVSTYNAIYGSFAALPMFMLWVNFSWIICLFCAQLTYASQNLKSYYYMKDIHKVSRNYHDLLLLLVLAKICKRFEKGMRPYTLYGLSVESHLPVGVVGKLVHELKRMNLVVMEHENDDRMRMVPAEDINRMTLQHVMERLDVYGSTTTLRTLKKLRPEWKRLMEIRHNYRFAEGDLLLKDLVD